MQSVGTKIREARERRNLSLEEINARTRISFRNLTAIESDDLVQISSPFAYRSFVKQIAEALELDYETLTPQVVEASNSMPTPLIPGEDELQPQREQKPQFEFLTKFQLPENWNWNRVLRVGSILVIAGGVSGYLIWSKGGTEAKESSSKLEHAPSVTSPEPVQKQPVPSAAKTLVPDTAPDIAEPDKKAEPEKKVEVAKAAPVQTEQAKPEPLKSDPPPAPVETRKPEVTEEPKPEPVPVAATKPVAYVEGPIHIEISVDQPTWMSIVSDGKTTFRGVLDVGDRKILDGRDMARIRTSDAGRLNVVFNGRVLGAMGRNNQARTFLFSREGYEVVQGAANAELSHSGPHGQ